MNNLRGFLSFHGNVSGQMGSNLITNVEANPAGTPTEILTSIRVGDIIYSIPSGGGGGGGSNNYNDLLNKPKINNVVLSGDLSLDTLGIQSKITFPMDSSKYLNGEGNFTTPPSSGSYSETELYSNPGTTNPATITLDESLFNYDIIVAQAVRTFDGVPNSVINTVYLTSLIDISYVLNILAWSGNNEFILYTITNNDTLTLSNQGNALYIDKLIGIKFS